MHWKEMYEDAADADYRRFAKLSTTDLLRRVSRREFGDYYTLWNAIADKRDLRATGWALFDFLYSDADYLHRYHCARALLALLDCTTYEPVQLSAGHDGQPQRLLAVAQLLEQSIGPRAADHR